MFEVIEKINIKIYKIINFLLIKCPVILQDILLED